METLKSVNRRIIGTLVRLEGKIDDMAERVATKEDFGLLMQRMDGFAAVLEDSRFRWAVHAALSPATINVSRNSKLAVLRK